MTSKEKAGQIVRLCQDCAHTCKQKEPAVIIRCPFYQKVPMQLSLFDTKAIRKRTGV